MGAKGFEPISLAPIFTGFFLAYVFITNRITDRFIVSGIIDCKDNHLVLNDIK